MLAVTNSSKGFGHLYKMSSKNICDLGVDCSGKAVDSVSLRVEFSRNAKRLTLLDGNSRLFRYSINKKAWDKT